MYRDQWRYLIRCTSFLLGLLLLTGCYVTPNQGADGPFAPGARQSSVEVSGQSVPIEPGVPFAIGTSVERRSLQAYRFGDGPVFIALIGGIHGGYEANTVALTERFVEVLKEPPDIIPPDVSVFVIPAMNPDGLQRPGPKGRVNANQVDLNRNWGCNWEADASSYLGVPFWTGAGPFSEPETRAVRDFLLDNDFKAVVFYHSRGAVIFYGECDGGSSHSWELAESVSQATGYQVVDTAEYPTTRALPGSITGEGADYFDSQGLAAIDVELSTREEHSIDWEENYRGLLAIMDYAVGAFVKSEASAS